MNLCNDNKYRRINEAKKGELVILKNKSINDRFKPNYHIHPEFGLLNDPNGLAYYKGKYRLFHQWYPFGPIHGMKHWAELESIDLVNWKRKGVAITPTEVYESHGAYSGGAIELNDKLYLYYTGNVKYDNGDRSANQCLAIMDEEGNIEKYKNNPLIKGVPNGYTGHVRDPKVFIKNNSLYMMLGAQRKNETGAFIIYKSENGIDWEFKGELKLESFHMDLGYMVECPDYMEIDGRDVLIFSPQGLKSEGEKYNNLFNVLYMIGKLDIENLVFTVESYDELDVGFDFYAPQSFKDKDNKTILFAWAGMGEFKYITDENMWAHCLTFPRDLRIKNNKIYQNPVSEIELLRDKGISEKGILENTISIPNESNSYELNINIKSNNSNKFGINILSSDKEKLTLTFDKEENFVILNRKNLINNFAEEYGFSRKCKLESFEDINIRILVDNSIVEIFINKGEKAFTTRAFPLENSTGIELFADNNIDYSFNKYNLRKSIN